MSVLKQEYNNELENFYKAVNIMDDLTIPNEKKDKWEPRFKDLLEKMKKLISDIEQEIGREVTEDEILNGF
jgi:DNA-directed RNA polymerase specialized sigma subunit